MLQQSCNILSLTLYWLKIRYKSVVTDGTFKMILCEFLNSFRRMSKNYRKSITFLATPFINILNLFYFILIIIIIIRWRILSFLSILIGVWPLGSQVWIINNMILDYRTVVLFYNFQKISYVSRLQTNEGIMKMSSYNKVPYCLYSFYNFII